MENQEMVHSTQKLQNDFNLIVASVQVKECKPISLFVCASDRFRCNGGYIVLVFHSMQ
jgi:hypothetical protein